ncbi:MAG TPA: hypothetical protein VMU89_01590 [Thermomicrobiaceae bacterium]|nr:hypothetical protein [Thermomicrobiaceae bacterium]
MTCAIRNEAGREKRWLGDISGAALGPESLLYLVTGELLVEAYQVPDTPLITAVVFAGFVHFPMLGMLRG